MIPVFEPAIGEEEIAAVVAALRRGEISGTFGQALTDFEREFAAYVNCNHGIAVSSGTTALQLAVTAAGLAAGEEVLVSASTNIATALAVAHNGGIPIPVDSEPVTWNLDLDLVEGLIGPKTRAIIPVHLYGHPVDMDELRRVADRHRLMIIEDCAESHGATCRGRMTGSFGQMACFSFYANKIITTGEGGMVVTNNDRLAQRLRLLRNLAFTTPRFLHHVLGFNFRMTGYQAAMGLVQLRKVESIVAQKRRVAHAYHQRLRHLDWLQLPTEREWARNVYWMYAVVVRRGGPVTRDQLMAALQDRGIETRTFFCPLDKQPCLQALPGFPAFVCPVADDLWETGLYLPSTAALSDETIDQVVDAIEGAAHAVR